MRDGVKRPAQPAAMHVKGADVARRAGAASAVRKPMMIMSADHAGRGQRHMKLPFAVQPGAQVDTAVLAEDGNRLSRGRVQGIEIIPRRSEQALFVAIAPPGQAALRAARLHPGMESPLAVFRWRHPARSLPATAYRHRQRHRSPADGSGDRRLPAMSKRQACARCRHWRVVIWVRLEKRRPPFPP